MACRACLQLSQLHYEQAIKSVADIAKDIELKEYREEHYMEPEEPIPTQDADVQQYYKSVRGRYPSYCRPGT